MSKVTRYNVSHSPAIPLLRHDEGAVPPGEPYEFTEEEAEHLGVEWSKVNPREGLEGEKAFKARRDRKPGIEPGEAVEAPADGTEAEVSND